MSEPRFWILDAANEENRLNEVQAAAQTPIYGIVDEEAGGIVAYACGEENARDLISNLERGNNGKAAEEEAEAHDCAGCRGLR